jgi:transcriptional regulator with XRE-family HTH domain
MARRVPGKPGWVEGSVDELLELEPWESELIELRLALADAVREKRSCQGLSQKELADRVGSTQPRVARLEQAEASLDAILRAVFALGASRDEVGRIVARRAISARRRRPDSHAEREVAKRPKRPLRRSA